MGCWGMGITQSDEFCEIYDKFMEEYDEGKAIPQITAQILAQYHEEFDDNDGVLHNIYFALAKAEWMCCQQSKEILKRVEQIICSGANLDFYKELGATQSDLKARNKNLNQFLLTLQTPRQSPRKRKFANKPLPAALKKGDAFWYRSNGNVFGALLLENIGGKVYFVAMTQRLEREPKSLDEVLNATVYMATWFTSLLPAKRVHPIGCVQINGSYNGRGGMYYSEKVQFVENFGMETTWAQTRKVTPYGGYQVRQLLDLENVPVCFRFQEELEKQIENARASYGEAGVKLL